MNLRDRIQSILILGAGESGQSMAAWCVSQGVAVTVADSRAQISSALQERVPDVRIVLGELPVELLTEHDAVAVSPGLSPHLPAVAAMLARAAELGKPVWGDIELFALALADLKATQGYSPRLVAITGTNGKTTTTRLVGHLARSCGQSAIEAGNISPAALDALSQALAEDALPDIWVLELSSFQLTYVQSLQADAATVLNITQDHLDWHRDMNEYAETKARIFGSETLQVLYRHDSLVMNMKKSDQRCVSVGLDKPVKPGDFGIVQEDGLAWLACAESAEDSAVLTASRRKKNPPLSESQVRLLMPVDALSIRGQHNAGNALAALALCRGVGLPLAGTLHGLRTFIGEPHRVQHIGTLNDVMCIDDSKGTNVGATVAALSGSDRPVVLIAGGDGKGQDFSPLLDVVQKHARAVMLIGKDAKTIESVLQDAGVFIQCFDTLQEATRAGLAYAQAGDALMLSPACASLDMFKNYAHRAQVFIETLQDEALERGIVL